MSKPITIELTAEEAQVLTNFLDVAVKASGLAAAAAALHFHNKIQAGLKAAESAPPVAVPTAP